MPSPASISPNPTSPAPHAPIGIIGLGLMGTALAHRLLDLGRPIRVWNRTRSKADPLLARGALWNDPPLADCARVFLCLFTREITADVLHAFRASLRPGQILIDTATGDAEHAQALAESLAVAGVHYLDAPISGSSDQTRRGEVTCIVGGPRETFDACADLWPCFARQTFFVGPVGAASRMKLVTNLVLGLNRLALAEGLVYAESQGIPPATALQILQGSAAASRTMETKGAKMTGRDYSVQARLDQHLKDVRIILHTAARSGLTLPVSELHQSLLEQASARGFGDADNSAIIESLRPNPAPAPARS